MPAAVSDFPKDYCHDPVSIVKVCLVLAGIYPRAGFAFSTSGTVAPCVNIGRGHDSSQNLLRHEAVFPDLLVLVVLIVVSFLARLACELIDFPVCDRVWDLDSRESNDIPAG